MPFIVRGALCAAVLLLAGCASQVPIATAPAPVVAAQPDPQRCDVRADCTSKVSRTLLFVFDYATVGGALVERRGRLLFTPADTVANDWPALRIRLAEPSDGRFDFSAECQVRQCRYSAVQLLRVYRSYLADHPCSLLQDDAVRACTDVGASR